MGKTSHYYGVRYSNNFLAHHGIKGQKWGVRNGPPYPLNSNTLADKIFNDAKKREPQITKDVTAAVKSSGGQMYGLEHRLKTKESLTRKIEKNSKEDNVTISKAALDIKDAVRYTSIANEDSFVSTYEGIKKQLEEKGYTERRCKNNFLAYREGKVKHKSVQCTYETPDGYKFEIQFQTPKSQIAKDKKTPIYEERRSLGIEDARAKELERQMDVLAKSVPDPKGIERIKSH